MLTTSPGAIVPRAWNGLTARDGVVEPNFTWKDAALVRAGETVATLRDVTDPGGWMAHCFIASFNVTA